MSDKPLRTSNWNAEQLQDNMSDTIARQLQTLQEEGVRAGDTITTPMITSSYDSESEASNAITTLGRLGFVENVGRNKENWTKWRLRKEAIRALELYHSR